MTRLACLALAVLVGSLTVASAPPVAWAAPKDDALQLYEKGKVAYRLGKFDEAIGFWKDAYSIKADPNYLYNIAQAHREKRDFANALFFYRQYLNDRPDAPNRGDVEKKIATMEKLVSEQRSAAEQPPQGPIGPTVPDRVRPAAEGVTTPERTDTSGETDTTPPAGAGRGARIAGIAAMGTGVAVVALGVLFALQASSAKSDIEAAAGRGDPWTTDLADRQSAGSRASTLSIVSFVVGTAAVVGGGVLYYYGHKKGAEARSALRIVPGAARADVGLTLELTF